MFHIDIPNGEVTKNFSEQFYLFHLIYKKNTHMIKDLVTYSRKPIQFLTKCSNNTCKKR